MTCRTKRLWNISRSDFSLSHACLSHVVKFPLQALATLKVQRFTMYTYVRTLELFTVSATHRARLIVPNASVDDLKSTVILPLIPTFLCSTSSIVCTMPCAKNRRLCIQSCPIHFSTFLSEPRSVPNLSKVPRRPQQENHVMANGVRSFQNIYWQLIPFPILFTLPRKEPDEVSRPKDQSSRPRRSFHWLQGNCLKNERKRWAAFQANWEWKTETWGAT